MLKGIVGLVCVDCFAVSVATSARFPSMIFFENSSATSEAEAAMHRDQVEFASHYALTIIGWGEDSASPPACRHEEEKLANISRLIKAASPSTLTATYAGQFEFVVPHYDLQRAVIDDPAYDGFFMKDDDGKFLHGSADCGDTFRFWDFRNASAVAYHTEQVAGYFAGPRGMGVDAVFFDEGDAFACQYSCSGNNLCKTMPDAMEWHKGDVQAWVGAAKVMAAAGKRAILSSQNAFNANSPELWKEDRPRGCPLREDAIADAMKEAGVPFLRFYEYWLVPEQFNGGHTPRNPWVPGSKSQTWKYCRNQVANAVEEGKRHGINFVAAGTSAATGWGTPERIASLEFSLAGFLIARSRATDATKHGWEAQSDYFGFDHQFNGNEKILENCSHTRWGDCSHRWSEVQAIYERDYGVPVTDAVEVGGLGSGRFFRQYSKVNITFDCGKDGPSGANFKWIAADSPNFSLLV